MRPAPATPPLQFLSTTDLFCCFFFFFKSSLCLTRHRHLSVSLSVSELSFPFQSVRRCCLTDPAVDSIRVFQRQTTNQVVNCLFEKMPKSFLFTHRRYNVSPVPTGKISFPYSFDGDPIFFKMCIASSYKSHTVVVT